MTIRQIEQLIEEGNSLKFIAQAYSEIANLKIKKIRTEVERNRLFFNEISQIFGIVKSFASLKNIVLKKPKNMISLLLTSNHGFYGKINFSLIENYIQSTRNLPTDRIIIGRVASEYFKTTKIFTGYKELILKDDMPTAYELSSIISSIRDYQQVLVCYAQLKTLLVQEPQVKDITAISSGIKSMSKKNIRFIFEPEISKILSFFDNQILTLLLEVLFLESELSRTASRFISMDMAEQEANKFIKEYERMKKITQISLDNIEILENFGALFATRKLTKL